VHIGRRISRATATIRSTEATRAVRQGRQTLHVGSCSISRATGRIRSIAAFAPRAALRTCAAARAVRRVRAGRASSRRSPGTRRCRPRRGLDEAAARERPRNSPSSPGATSRRASPAGGRRPSARRTMPRMAASARSTWRRRASTRWAARSGSSAAGLGAHDECCSSLRRGRGSRQQPDQDRAGQAEGARRAGDRSTRSAPATTRWPTTGSASRRAPTGC
jgi:hypothetical protein